MDGRADNSELTVVKQSRPGGRAERLVSVIHQVTFELLQKVSYEEIEIPDIAKLAEVNKTTIYRRWPTKIALILDVVLTRIKADVPLPNTGHVIDDLSQFLKIIAFTLQTPFTLNILRALMNTDDENIRQARKDFWDERFLLAKPLIDRAIERSELAETTQVREFFELAAAPLFYRILVTGDQISDQDIELMAKRAVLVFENKDEIK